MKTTTVSEARNGLSALLKRVKGGETVLITHRGIPIARIEPVHAPDDPTGRLDRLVRAGIIRPGSGNVPASILAGPTVRAASMGGSVLDADRRPGSLSPAFLALLESGPYRSPSAVWPAMQRPRGVEHSRPTRCGPGQP
jgi:prevent-host-death family protein